jgi:hypothetical protein
MASMTQQQWSIAFVRALGNVSPAPNIVDFVVAWGRAEGGGGTGIQGSTNNCYGNFLNTCQAMPGSFHCAGPCVQSYRSNNDGIYANATALRNGNYPSLLHALQVNDSNALGYNGHKMSADIAGDLSVWVSGNRTGNLGYAAKIAGSAGAQASTDTTSGGKGGTQPVSSTGSTQGSSSSSNPLDWIKGIFGGPTLAWIQNPMRVIKLVAGLICIGISLFLLAAPAENAITQAVAPIAKSAAVFA